MISASLAQACHEVLIMKSILFGILLFLIIPSVIHAQTGKWMLMRQTIVTGGGGFSSSPTRELFSSLAYPIVGKSRNTTRILYSGFLPVRSPGKPTDVIRLPQLPNGIVLHQNYPNPFTQGGTTNLTYELDGDADVQLCIYSILGKRVATIVEQRQRAGTYNATFDAASLPAGMYVAELRVSSGTVGSVRRISMVLLK
jgi:hypothetical protein